MARFVLAARNVNAVQHWISLLAKA